LEAILTFSADCRILLAQERGKTLPSWNAWDNNEEEWAAANTSKVLVVDVGGTPHQDAGDGQKEARKIPSGPR